MYAYAAAEKATAAQSTPDGWPDGWTWPPANGDDGPWPPGWGPDGGPDDPEGGITWCGLDATFSVRVQYPTYSIDFTITGNALVYGTAAATYPAVPENQFDIIACEYGYYHFEGTDGSGRYVQFITYGRSDYAAGTAGGTVKYYDGTVPARDSIAGNAISCTDAGTYIYATVILTVTPE